jgi:hypothetical protein
MTVFWIVGSHQGGTGAAGRDEVVKFPYEGLLHTTEDSDNQNS